LEIDFGPRILLHPWTRRPMRSGFARVHPADVKARPSRGLCEGNNMPPRSECMSQSVSVTVFGGQQVSSYGAPEKRIPSPPRQCAHPCSRDHTPQSPPGTMELTLAQGSRARGYFGLVDGGSVARILSPASVYCPKRRTVAIASKETGTHIPPSSANCRVI
jgi:hypothetical protein